MISIRTAEALLCLAATHPDATLRQLLSIQAERLADYDLSEIAMLIVVEPSDTLEALEVAIGRPLRSMLPCELTVRHGDVTEWTFILSDDGFGLILYIPDNAHSALTAAITSDGVR